jgi:16S rRNA (uracil1498-N3)-methyltransferase
VPPRFFAPELSVASGEVVLPPGESLHLARVLRLQSGAPVEVFDGRGLLREAVVSRASPSASVVVPGAHLDAAPEAPAAIVVVQALLKGDAMDAVVRDATVLGAVEVRPLIAARSNVPARAASAAHERWERIAIAAAKQCGRAVLPRIAPAASMADVLAGAHADTPIRLWLTEPGASRGDSASLPLPPRGVSLAIGPEGGWTPDEVSAARDAGWSAWTLAPVTLRAEQVTLAALSVLRYTWDDAARRRIT